MNDKNWSFGASCALVKVTTLIIKAVCEEANLDRPLLLIM